MFLEDSTDSPFCKLGSVLESQLDNLWCLPTEVGTEGGKVWGVFGGDGRRCCGCGRQGSVIIGGWAIWVSVECHAGSDVIIKVIKWNGFSIKEVNVGILKKRGVKEFMMCSASVLVVCSDGTVTVITSGIKGRVVARGNRSCVAFPSIWWY